MKADSQLLATGGTYLVMSQLALEGFHASCTFGNAPFVDVLVSTRDGSRTVAVQVKTARDATHWRGKKGAKKRQLQWAIGYKAATTSRPHLLVVLVDLRGRKQGEIPDIYCLPSEFICNYCAQTAKTDKWVRLHISSDLLEPYKNKWTALENALLLHAPEQRA